MNSATKKHGASRSGVLRRDFMPNSSQHWAEELRRAAPACICNPTYSSCACWHISYSGLGFRCTWSSTLKLRHQTLIWKPNNNYLYYSLGFLIVFIPWRTPKPVLIIKAPTVCLGPMRGPRCKMVKVVSDASLLHGPLVMRCPSPHVA